MAQVDSFSLMFPTAGGSQKSIREQKRSTQINFRCTPAFRDMAAGMATHLDCSIADVMEQALEMLAKSAFFEPWTKRSIKMAHKDMQFKAEWIIAAPCELSDESLNGLATWLKFEQKKMDAINRSQAVQLQHMVLDEISSRRRQKKTMKKAGRTAHHAGQNR